MKILFITLSNIGDAVMTTPVFIYFYKKYPEAQFYIVCDKKCSGLFEFFPNVKKIILKEKNKGFINNYLFIKTLREQEYDIGIDLRTDLLLYFIKAKNKFFKKNNKDIHSIKKHFYAINEDIINIPHPHIFIPDNIKKHISCLLPKAKKTTLSIALGANSSHKIWPVKSFIELTDLLKNKIEYIFLVGDKNDKAYGDLFKKKSKVKTLNFCGDLSIIETAEVINQSKFFIGNDSGLGHIASAVKTPSLTIFGDGDPKRYAPWGVNASWYQNHEKNIELVKPLIIFQRLKNLI